MSELNTCLAKKKLQNLLKVIIRKGFKVTASVILKLPPV